MDGGNGMSYRASENKTARTVLMIIVGILVAGLVKVAVTAGFEQLTNWDKDWPAEVETHLQSEPTTAALYSAMKTNFPDEYGRLKAQFANQLQKGASEAEIRSAGFNFMRQFAKSQMKWFAQAPEDELSAFRANQLAALDALAADSDELCGRYVMNGLSVGDRPGPDTVQALSTATASQLRAAARGRDAPVGRPTGELTEAESIEFVKALQQNGMTDSELQIFADEAKLTNAPATQQCILGGKMLRAVNSMPAKAAGRVTSYLMLSQAVS
jgi:hypothetical protein